jgi:glycerol uptake facilitator-like aquaporin
VTIPLHKRLFAEAFGTFWIVFAGTGAIVVGDLTSAISLIGVALAVAACWCVREKNCCARAEVCS